MGLEYENIQRMKVMVNRLDSRQKLHKDAPDAILLVELLVLSAELSRDLSSKVIISLHRPRAPCSFLMPTFLSRPGARCRGGGCADIFLVYVRVCVIFFKLLCMCGGVIGEHCLRLLCNACWWGEVSVEMSFLLGED